MQTAKGLLRTSLWLLSTASALMSGCDGNTTAEVSSEQQPLFTPEGWGTGPHAFNVCWRKAIHTNTAYEARRNDIRNWIMAELPTKAPIQFNYWGECPANESGYLPFSYNSANNYSHGGSGGVEYGTDVMDSTSIEDARGRTLHEMMHVLGFMHEVDRIDQPASDQGPGGACGWVGLQLNGTMWTTYDRYSILNYTYCGLAMNVLSPWDIAGLQRAYGALPMTWTAEFGNNAGWREDQYPRTLADVNGDGRKDIVGFGHAGVHVALSTGREYGNSQIWLDAFGLGAGGWQVSEHPRMMADVNGDGKADVVGFGAGGVYVSLSTGTGFTAPEIWVGAFGTQSGGWRVDAHPRMMADVNADGKADVVGFGEGGVHVSISTGTGFTAPELWVGAFGPQAGGWRVDSHPRMMADVNGDGKADVVGFGEAGVFVSLSTGTGFTTPGLWVAAFGAQAGGWRMDSHPRMMADVNGDGRTDVVGFGYGGVYVSQSVGNAFGNPELWTGDFGANGWSMTQHPRVMADVNGDGKADVVGFGQAGVYYATSTGTGLAGIKFHVGEYGVVNGWNNSYPRIMADVNGDGHADIVGFAQDRVLVTPF